MCGVYSAGSSCRCGTRRGACPVGCRITLPPRRPRGAWRCWLPADSAFSLLFCPLSPHPPSPAGKGEIFVILCKGLRPLHPRGWRGAALVRRALAAPGGCLPGWSPNNLAVPAPGGGLLSWSPAYPAFCLLFCPHPPNPLPGGKGEILSLFRRGLPPPAPRHQTAYGTDSPCHSDTRRGRAFLVTC